MSVLRVRLGACGRGSGRVEAGGFADGLAVVGGGSGRVAVLVDEPVAAGVSSDRSAESILDDQVVRGRVLFERPVGAVRVVVLDVVAWEPLELAAVPDEGAVEELAAHGGDPVRAEYSSGPVICGFARAAVTA
jgi:hypothetical protein